ncbi:thioeseterase, partial [Escherichia coli]|nr:thioeseterase [Escherichia coli]
MYPFFRMTKERVKHRSAGALQPGDAHLSHHLCWPWDLDIWNELNNGRTLTLFDLGRLPL